MDRLRLAPERVQSVVVEIGRGEFRIPVGRKTPGTIIEAFARQDPACERLMTVPGIGPIISSAMVAAIGAGDAFSKGRDFAAWLGLGLIWFVASQLVIIALGLLPQHLWVSFRVKAGAPASLAAKGKPAPAT